MMFTATGNLAKFTFVLGIILALMLEQIGACQDGETKSLRVMAWNIWHGGREDGEEIGPQRVVDVIKSTGADIVAMQETSIRSRCCSYSVQTL